jgi:hypothetical protein
MKTIIFISLFYLLSSLSVCYAQSDSDTTELYKDVFSIGIGGGYLHKFDEKNNVPAMFMLNLEMGGKVGFLLGLEFENKWRF